MSEQTIKPKEILIKHHKLGDIKLGKIPNNEKCRMILQLLQEKQKQNNTIMMADAVFNKMGQKTLNTAIEKVKNDIETNKKKLDKVKKNEKLG